MNEVISAADVMRAMPDIRGKWREQAVLAKTNWFQVGGPAEVLFRPQDAEDLAYFLAHKPKGVKVTVLGVGSNIIVRDGGLDGVVIKLGAGFAEVTHEERGIRAGAGALDVQTANAARDWGVTGLEFLSGIPGTIGGALRMNAGAYGREMQDVLLEARALDEQGKLHVLRPEDMGFVYRKATNVPEGWIFVDALLKAEQGDNAAIAAEMERIAEARASTQPIKARTGGSTFKNPEGYKAWQLVDAAGCRGLTIGAAQMSELHCNFMLNLGGAKAADLEALGEEVIRRVREHSGVALEWEIRRIGKEQA